MATAKRFTPHVEVAGEGDPIVFVHGGWTDGSRWSQVVPGLAETNTVVTYDRRGHSRSVWSGPVTRRTDENDLIDLIERLDLGPAHLVGNSYGGAIVLGVASRRPDLVRSVSAHEPPLLSVAAFATRLRFEFDRILRLFDDLACSIGKGETESAVATFVDDVVFVPGAWSMMPDSLKALMISNADTFVGMLEDPLWHAVPRPSDGVPVMLTDGAASPYWLPAIVAALIDRPYRHAQHVTFAGAGHAPQASHPAEFVEVTRSFISAL